MLLNQLEAVLETHEYAHSVQTGVLEKDHSDVHCCTDFLRNLESEGNWRDGRITIQLSLGFDGFPISQSLK